MGARMIRRARIVAQSLFQRLGRATPIRLVSSAKVRLLSHNPRKLAGGCGEGVSVSERVPIEILATATTERYLRTKKNKLGHVLSSV